MKLRLISIIAIVTGLYHLYIAAFGTNSTMGLRVTHWIFISALCFLCFPLLKRSKNWYWDAFMVIAAVVPGVYFLLTWSDNVQSVGLPSTMEIIMGVLLIITVLEAARRTVGFALTLISAAFLVYALYGHLIPGVMGHREYSISRLTSYLYQTSDGVYGVALGVSATFIVLFILFGAFLNVSGAGRLFMDIAIGLTGKKRGGPAKAAITSSAIMGMISGSPVGNVVTVGVYTIPLMKKSGYKDYEAGAIEAVSSTGGMIVPPVMGAAAFIMADYLNLPYSRIVLAAIIPAFLYYLALYVSTHFRAYKNNISSMSDEDLPNFRASFKKEWFLFIPLVLLVYWLVIGWSPMKAALWSIVSMLVLMFLRPNRKEAIKKLFEAIEQGIRETIPVAVACAVAGIIVGVINLTGMAVKFSSFMISVSNGNTFLILAAVMIGSLIMGMGLPATALYILLATLSAPAIIEAGFTPLAAHMFVFFFGMISAITPPVALAAYAASGISKSNPNKTGFHAFRLGMAAYIIPFIFAYNPAMLMEGNVGEVIQVAISSIIGVFFFAVAVEGHVYRKMLVFERLLCVIGSILLLIPETLTDILGYITIVVFILVYRIMSKRNAAYQSGQIKTL